MSEPLNTNEATEGRSDSTEVLATNSCRIRGVFVFGNALAVCEDYCTGNICQRNDYCVQKIVANK